MSAVIEIRNARPGDIALVKNEFRDRLLFIEHRT